MRLSSASRPALAGALLCLLLLAAACGGGGTTTVTETVAGGETSSAPEPEPATGGEDEGGGEDSGGGGGEDEGGAKAGAGGIESFQTPSGNIGCYIGPEGARCDVADRDWTAPRPDGCPSQVDYGQGVEVTDSGPAVVCAGDTALNPEARPLAYGGDIRAGDFTCHSREDGVECLDDGDGRGFFVSKQSYRVF